MNGLRTTVIRETAHLAALVPEWRGLWQRAEPATPFQSPDWLLPWWDVFAPGDLRCIAVYVGERLIALAPLYREGGNYGSRLLPLGVSLSDYLDVLVDPAYPGSVDALATAIAAMDDIEAVEWSEMQANADALHLAPPAGWDAICVAASPCPVVPLPDTPETLREIISPSRWRHLRTARNRAARCGEASILEGDVDNSVPLLNELVRLHSASCAKRGGNVFSDPRVVEFQAAALPDLAKNELVRFYALGIAGKIVAVYYGFQHRDRAYAYQCGYDPAFAFHSPGMLLIMHAMEQAIRESAREFHFLRGNEPYKYEWGARDRMNVCRRLVRRQQRPAHG